MKKCIIVALIISCGFLTAPACAENYIIPKTDYLSKEERQQLSLVLEKLQFCRLASFNTPIYSAEVVSTNTAICIWQERIGQNTITCKFPHAIAKKYAANAIILNNLIMEQKTYDFAPNAQESLMLKENTDYVMKYCKNSFQ